MDTETRALVLAADRGQLRSDDQCYLIYAQAVGSMSELIARLQASDSSEIGYDLLWDRRDSLAVCIEQRECTVAELRMMFRQLVREVREFRRMVFEERLIG